MKQLSIIIPVYNTGKYLDDCLTSLLHQDIPHEQYEIICVNDGSTDNSLEILNGYASDNENIQVIDQQNAGHAAARNVGLQAAQGRYVWFVDSDDYIDAGCLGFLLRILNENQIDFLTVGLTSVSSESHFNNSFYKYENSLTEKLPKHLACSGNRIILRELIVDNHIIWDKRLSPNDDTVFLFYVQLYSRKKAYLPSINYYRRVHSASVTSIKSLAGTKKHISSFMVIAEIFQKEYECCADSKIKHNLKLRIALTVKAILFDAALIYTKKERREFISLLKSKNLYPYTFLWIDLWPKISLKRTLMDWSMLFFPFEFYYDLYSALMYNSKIARRIRS